MFMKLFSIFFFVFVLLRMSFGQLNDDFSDGDFTSNPTWQGDDTEFIIDINNQLQLNAPSVTDTSFLSVETGILDFTSNITWEFFVKLDLSPSNSNNFRFYLTSDNANLQGYLNGYFIRVGENGSTDKLKLYRQDGFSTSLLATGLNGAYGVNPEFRVRVNRDINGNWEVLSDSTGASNFIYEAGATDNSHTFSTFVGVWCKHTSSYTDNFYFDDIVVSGNVINDNDAPMVQDAFVIGDNLIEIQYSEPVTSSAESITNYSLNFSNGNPLLVTLSLTGYELMFNNPFSANDTLVLDISNISDLSGNILNTTIDIVVPDTADQGDLLINEILFDPLSGGYDFVEIYNASSSAVDLFGYMLADYDDGIGNFKAIDQHFVLNPEGLAVFTEDSMAILNEYLSNDPNAFVQMDIPTFPNDSATVYILSPDSNVIDRFSYDDDMHFELINDPEGVSLEKVNSNYTSNDPSNWHSAAESVGWATPGMVNSQVYNGSLGTGFFKVETEVFSPDNDGYEDVAVFSYNLNASGSVGSVVVYDKNGRIIKRVLNNELLGTEGQLTWDGTNEQGNKASVGIYLVYFESFTANGKVFSRRSPITLKTRF
jgi:hypothetical protein